MKKIIHHIKKIRQQPEHIRKSILHLTVGIFAVLLFSLWIYSLGNNTNDEEAKIDVDENLKPFSVLKENITNSYDDLSNEDLKMVYEEAMQQ